jgi:SseB protein N-terminal domain/SseB protein C-terminal domain
MLFIAENELERALVAAVKDPASGPDFYRLLLEQDLLVLGTVEGQEDASDKIALKLGGKLNLVSGLKEGSRYLPVFSSLTRLQEYVKQDSKYLSINGRALLEWTHGAPVTLNPASEYGKELTPDQIRQLLGGPAPLRVIAGQAEYPTALVEGLTQLFAVRPDIQTAWMIQLTNADPAQEPHPLVGIETVGDWPSLMQAVQAMAQTSVPGMMFDVQRVDRRNPGGMTGALLQVPPFYQRAGGPTLN